MKQNQEAVRIALVGVGARGMGLLKHLVQMDDIEITVLCDLYPERVDAAAKMICEAGKKAPQCFLDYQLVLNCQDVDGIILPTPMTSHATMVTEALRAKKHIATEVGGAASLSECWDLVQASEETGYHCMMLENCCYGRKEMMLLNMVRKGLFGELVFCRGGYLHDLRQLLMEEHEKNHHTRIYNYINRNGDIYPTHGLGPMAKLLRINKGNRMVSLTAVASKGVGMEDWIRQHRDEESPLYSQRFSQGDIVNTVIRCANGEQIIVTHDTTLPRPYSRGGRVQGDKGIWLESSIYGENKVPYHFEKNGMLYLDQHSPVACLRSEYRELWESFDNYFNDYEHPLWREYLEENPYGNNSIRMGMDELVLRAFVNSVRTGERPAIDVYDAAAWMSITCLSEESIAHGGEPVAIPDFTNGRWIKPELDTNSRYSLDEINASCFT